MKKKIKYRTYIDYDYGTVGTRDKETGRMTGRKVVKGYGDRTAVKRVYSPAKYSGRIVGRTEPIKVKGNAHSRGYSYTRQL